MIEGLATEAIWLLIGTIGSLVGYTFITLLPGQRRKERMFRFFGINRTNPSFTLYFSNLGILEKYTTSTFARKSENKITFGGYQGWAAPEGELLVINSAAEILTQDPLAGLPLFLRRWLAQKFIRFRQVTVTFSLSPPVELPDPQFKFSPLLSVGSQTYNSVTDYFVNYQSGYLRFKPANAGEPLVIEVLKGRRKGEIINPRDADASGALGYLEKIIDEDHKTVTFIAASAGVVGTVGAAQFLFRDWESLEKTYGNKTFAVTLDFALGNGKISQGLEPIEISYFP